MELITDRLNRLFSVHSSSSASQDAYSHASLSDISIAYGLLLKDGVDSQCLCDQLSQEVKIV